MQGQQRLHVLAYKSKGELQHLLSLRFTSKTTYCHLIAFFLFSVFHSSQKSIEQHIVLISRFSLKSSKRTISSALEKRQILTPY